MKKKNENGQIIKSYYIEINGKIDSIPENKITQLKNEYYETKKINRLKTNNLIKY